MIRIKGQTFKDKYKRIKSLLLRWWYQRWPANITVASKSTRTYLEVISTICSICWNINVCIYDIYKFEPSLFITVYRHIYLLSIIPQLRTMLNLFIYANDAWKINYQSRAKYYYYSFSLTMWTLLRIYWFQ